MHRLTVIRRWVPRYFGRVISSVQPRQHVTPKDGVCAPPRTHDKRQPHRRCSLARVSHARHDRHLFDAHNTSSSTLSSCRRPSVSNSPLAVRGASFAATRSPSSLGAGQSCETVHSLPDTESSATRTLSRQLDSVVHTAQTLLHVLEQRTYPEIKVQDNSCGGSRLCMEKVDEPRKARRQGEEGLSPKEMYVHFAARRDVFAPLRSLLTSPVHPSLSYLTNVASSQSSIATTTASSLMPTSDADEVVVSRPSRMQWQQSRPPLSIDALTSLLMLYTRIECEDGLVLRQLMQEVRRALMVCTEEPSSAPQRRRREKLPLPRLLLCFTELHVVEEKALQYIIARPPSAMRAFKDQTTARTGATADKTCVLAKETPHRHVDRGGLLYNHIARYDVWELIVLIHVWHHFSLHHDYAFVRTVTALQRYVRLPVVRTWTRAMRLAERKVHAISSSVTATTTAARSALAEIHSLHAMSQPPPELLCTFDAEKMMLHLLVALTAFTQSVHRQPSTVTFVADLTVAVAAKLICGDADCRLPAGDRARQDGAMRSTEDARNEEAHTMKMTNRIFRSKAMSMHNGRGDTVRVSAACTLSSSSLLALSKQLLRAAQLCEEMKLPQPLLAQVFAWCCEVSGKGVIVNGGEASEVLSDRVAYYDNVTADLIKAKHA